MLAHSDYHSLWQLACFQFDKTEFAIEAINGRTISTVGACAPEVPAIPVALGKPTSSINSHLYAIIPRGRRFEEPLRGVVGGRVAARVRGLERKAGGTTGLLVLAWGHNSAAIASAATSRDQAFSRSPVKTGNGKLNRFRDGMLCSASPPVPYPLREQSLVLAW